MLRQWRPWDRPASRRVVVRSLPLSPARARVVGARILRSGPCSLLSLRSSGRFISALGVASAQAGAAGRRDAQDTVFWCGAFLPTPPYFTPPFRPPNPPALRRARVESTPGQPPLG